MLWYNLTQPPKIGLAAPIKKLIDTLSNLNRLTRTHMEQI